jgi:hypothetical protein
MTVRVAITHRTEYRYDRPVLCGRRRMSCGWVGFIRMVTRRDR